MASTIDELMAQSPVPRNSSGVAPGTNNPIQFVDAPMPDVVPAPQDQPPVIIDSVAAYKAERQKPIGDIMIVPRAARSDSNSGSIFGGGAFDPSLMSNTVTDEDADNSFLAKMGGRLVSALGGATYLAGMVGEGINDLLGGDEAKDTAIGGFLMRNGRGLAEYGQEVVDDNTSAAAKQVIASINTEMEDKSVPLAVRFMRAAGHMTDEGGGELAMTEIAGSAVEMIAGGLLGKGASLMGRAAGRVAARAAGRKLVTETGEAIAKNAAESLLEAQTAGSFLRRRLTAAGDVITSAPMLGMAATQTGNVAIEVEDQALKQLQELGDKRKNLVGWQRTRDAYIAANGREPTDDEVDLMVARSATQGSAALAGAATIGMMAVSPLSEGAFSRAISRLSVGALRAETAAAPAATTVGGLMRRTGAALTGALQEGVSEGVEELVQSGLPTPEAVRTQLNGGTAMDALRAGAATPAAHSGAVMGALMGAVMGGGMRAVERSTAAEDAAALSRQIDESGRRMGAAETSATERAAQERALQALTDKGGIAGEQATKALADARAAQAAPELERQAALARKAAQDKQLAEEWARFQETAKQNAEASQRVQAEAHNTLNYSALMNVTQANPAVIGEKPVFGVGSKHTVFSDGDQRRVVFSTEKAALAVDESTGRVLFATADNAQNWNDLSTAPAEWQHIARPAVIIGSTETSTELTYEAGVAAGTALDVSYGTTYSPNATAQITALGDNLRGTITSAVDMLRQRASQEHAAVDADVAELSSTLDARMADLRRTLPVEEWHRVFAKRSLRGQVLPPAGAFDYDPGGAAAGISPGRRIGAADYQAMLDIEFQQRLARIDARLSPDNRRAAANFLRSKFPTLARDPVANVLLDLRDDLPALRNVAGGRQRTVVIDGRRRSIGAQQQELATELVRQHELRALYRKVLGAKSEASRANAIMDIAATENPQAQAEFDANVQAMLAARGADMSAMIGQQVDALMAQRAPALAQADLDLALAARVEQAAQRASTVADLLRTLNMLPPTLDDRAIADDLTRVETGVSIAGMMTRDMPMRTTADTMNVARLQNAITQYAEASEGPAHAYGAHSKIAVVAPSTDLQERYSTAVRELGVFQLAQKINDGADDIEVALSMIRDYGVSPDLAGAYFLRATQLLQQYTTGERVKFTADMREAEARVDALMREAITEAHRALPDNLKSVVTPDGALVYGPVPQQGAAQTAPAAAPAPAPAAAPASAPKTDPITVMMQGPGMVAAVEAATDATKPKTVAADDMSVMTAMAGDLGVDYVDQPLNAVSFEQVEQFAAEQRTNLAHLADSLMIVVHRTLADAKRAVLTPHDNFAALYEEGSMATNYRSVIHLVADRMQSAEQMKRKFRHELVGHFGLRRLLGGSMSLVRDLITDIAQRPGAHGEAGKAIKPIWDALYNVWADEARKTLANNNREPTDAAVRNLVDKSTGRIAEETLAVLAEYGMENKLVGAKLPSALSSIFSHFKDAGLPLQNVSDLRDVLHAAEGFVNDKRPETLKKMMRAHDLRNRAAYEAGHNQPFMRVDTWGQRWAALVSDMAGVRHLEALVERLAPQLSEQAAELRRKLENATTAVTFHEREITDAYIHPLRRRLTDIGKELNLPENEVYAYFSALMVERHIAERNRSFWLLKVRSHLIPETVIEQRDKMVALAETDLDGSRGERDTVVDRIEELFNSVPQARALMEAALAEDKKGISGMSVREARELAAAVPDAFKKAMERAEVYQLHDAAQEALLERRRDTGSYGTIGYARTKMHGWKHYIPLTKSEVGDYDGDTRSIVHVINPDKAYKRARERLQYVTGDDEFFATTGNARIIRGGNGELNLMILHTMAQDAYYTAQDAVTHDIGTRIVELVNGLRAASPEHRARMDETYINVEDPVPFSMETLKGASPLLPNMWVVPLPDGSTQRVHFKDELLARAFGSRFDQSINERPVAKQLQKFTRFLGMAFTVFNPGFVFFRQLPRDIQQNIAIAVGEHGISVGNAAGITTATLGYVPAFEKFFLLSSPEKRTETLNAARKDASHPLHKFARRYDQGGITLFDESLRMDAGDRGAGREFQTTLKPAGFSGTIGAMASKVADIANANASAVDHSSRQALFDVLITPKDQGGAGMSDAKAAEVVRNTMNFANRSRAGRFMSPYWAFAQTALTSLDTTWESRLWKGGKVPRVVETDAMGSYKVKLRSDWVSQINAPFLAARIASGFIMTAMAAAMLGGDDDEFGRDSYSKLDLRTLLTNILIPNPLGDEPLRIPVQVGFDSVFHALGAAAFIASYDDYRNHNANLWSETAAIMQASLTPFSTDVTEELGLGSVMGSLLPTAIAPLFTALGENRLGRELEKDPQRYANTATNPLLVDVSQHMEELFGFSIPPEAMRTLSREYLGGIWRAVDHASKWLMTGDENLQLVQQGTAGSALNAYLGVTASDERYDAQQSYYYFKDQRDRLMSMLERAKDMDGLPRGTDGFRYEPKKIKTPADLAKLPPNVRAFHTKYGALYSESGTVLSTAADDLARIKSEIAVRRQSGKGVEQIGQLMLMERRVYETNAALLRRMFSNQKGDLLGLDEPKYVRWWAN